MRPVVELEGVVGVSELLFCQFFAFAQAASLFVFGFWRKRLGKSRELCQVFFLQGRTLGHRQEENGPDNFCQ